MRFLGIDYGKKKVGLAISEGLTASPYKTLSISSLEDAINQISNVINKESIEMAIVGLPESGEAFEITKKFISMLSQIIKIVEVDETLSSKEALKKMINLGSSRKKRNQQEDAYSATIILQNFLDSYGA